MDVPNFRIPGTTIPKIREGTYTYIEIKGTVRFGYETCGYYGNLELVSYGAEHPEHSYFGKSYIRVQQPFYKGNFFSLIDEADLIKLWIMENDLEHKVLNKKKEYPNYVKQFLIILGVYIAPFVLGLVIFRNSTNSHPRPKTLSHTDSLEVRIKQLEQIIIKQQ